VIAGGGAIRLIPILGSSFPLNDGGLFLAMMRGIQSQGFGLPDLVNYNAQPIPLAYPPLGLLLGAGTSSATGISLYDIERWVPLAISTLTIPAAYLLFRQTLSTEVRAIIATAAFAVMPRSYNWMIVGGGITRAPGLLLALLTLATAVHVYRTGRLRWAIGAGVLLGLTALSHPQAGVFAGIGLGVLVPFTAVHRSAAVRSMTIALAVALFVVAPWLVMVLTRYGPETMLGAAQNGGSLQDSLKTLIRLHFSEGFAELMSIIGAFGLFVCLINRRWLFPVWLGAIFLAGSRGALTFGSVAVSGAAAYGIVDCLRLLRIPEPKQVCELVRAPAALVALAVIFAAASADAIASPLGAGSPLRALPSEERLAMDWIAANTAGDAHVLVVSGTTWSIDATSEWFPVLAGRESPATPQGTEWLGPGTFQTFERRYNWLQWCAATTELACAKEWSDQVGSVDYVMAVRSREATLNGYDCCLAFADRLIADGGKQVYTNEDVRIVRVELGGGG
jgi:hypothetical protein